MVKLNRLLIAFLTCLGILFIACDAIGSVTDSATSNCYVDDFNVKKVVDKNGVTFEPRKMTLRVFGGFEEDFCGISSDATPDEHTFTGTFGVKNTYPVFEVPPDGVEDTRASLAGNKRDLPSLVIIGTQNRGEFSDKLPMWPLHNSEWR